MDRRHFLKRSLEISAAAGVAALSTPTAALAQSEARKLNLRITDLKTYVMNAGGDENYVFVKIYTNHGLTGRGEATLPSKA